jgi:hypothetical protein
MRRWIAIAAAAGAVVGDRAVLWLPGALIWLCTVGWIPLVLGVTPPPSEGDLIFLGARFFGSALWPWNALAIGIGALLVAAMLLALAAAGDAALLDELGARRRGLRLAPGLFGMASLTSLPALVAVAVLAAAILNVAPGEFSAPDDSGGSGAIVRTLVAVAPFLALFLVAAGVGGALYAAAARLHHDRGEEVIGALAGAPRLLASAGWPAAIHVAVSGGVRIVLIVLSAVLLRVLWEPVGERLAVAEVDVVTTALLVGFVAIWLCLVLAGGAVQAWASAGWSILVFGRRAGAEPDRRRQESPIDR